MKTLTEESKILITLGLSPVQTNKLPFSAGLRFISYGVLQEDF
jgi:hypothetical protein